MNVNNEQKRAYRNRIEQIKKDDEEFRQLVNGRPIHPYLDHVPMLPGPFTTETEVTRYEEFRKLAWSIIWRFLLAFAVVTILALAL